MVRRSPEEELERFLSQQPPWRRKWLQMDTLSPNEAQLWFVSDHQTDWRVRDEYECIIRHIPDKWRDYRRKWKRIALSNVPSGSPGRPRSDALAEEADALYRAGKSYAQIATLLGKKYATKTKKGFRQPTAESIRKLLKSRQLNSQPDKT